MMKKDPFSLKPVDRVEIVTIIDNYVDVLLQSSETVTRPPMSKEQELPTDGLVAEHGLSQPVRVVAGDTVHSMLFDTGYTQSGGPRFICAHQCRDHLLPIVATGPDEMRN